MLGQPLDLPAVLHAAVTFPRNHGITVQGHIFQLPAGQLNAGANEPTELGASVDLDRRRCRSGEEHPPNRQHLPAQGWPAGVPCFAGDDQLRICKACRGA